MFSHHGTHHVSKEFARVKISFEAGTRAAKTAHA